jgi:uncharacterized protein
MSGGASLTVEAAPEVTAPGTRRLQRGIVALATVLLGGGAALLARTYERRHAVLFAPILAAGQGLGPEVNGAVGPVSVSVLVGGFIFAIGMPIGGGCGTLVRLGAGTTSLAPTLLGFVAGSVVATHGWLWGGGPAPASLRA